MFAQAVDAVLRVVAVHDGDIVAFHHLVRQARSENRARRRHRCRQDHRDQPHQPVLSR